jgi:Ca2+/H+ antiporter
MIATLLLIIIVVPFVMAIESVDSGAKSLWVVTAAVLGYYLSVWATLKDQKQKHRLGRQQLQLLKRLCLLTYLQQQ